MNTKIYLDNNATTLIDPIVASVVYKEMLCHPANASSTHSYGQVAKAKLTKARHRISRFLKVKPSEIIFTSGGTESMNLLIQGFCKTLPPAHIISSNIEHSCVIKPLEALVSLGWVVTFLAAGEKGYIHSDQVKEALRGDTKAIVLGTANSETGVINDIDAIAELALSHQIALIIDAVGTFGKEPFTIHPAMTAVGFSAHKFHGPKGCGFCYIKSPYKIQGIFQGGAQENTLRAGTENLPAIMGLAEAVDRLETEGLASDRNVRFLRDTFEDKILKEIGDVQINGGSLRACNVSNLYFEGLDGETLLIQLDLHGVLASHGSACSSGSIEPSRVLQGMGYTKNRARGSIRFSLSRFTTEDEIEKCVEILKSLCYTLRSMC